MSCCVCWKAAAAFCGDVRRFQRPVLLAAGSDDAARSFSLTDVEVEKVTAGAPGGCCEGVGAETRPLVPSLRGPLVSGPTESVSVSVSVRSACCWCLLAALKGSLLSSSWVPSGCCLALLDATGLGEASGGCVWPHDRPRDSLRRLRRRRVALALPHTEERQQRRKQG